MKSTVIIYKRGQGYVMDCHGQHGGGHQGSRAGLTPQEAAVSAARAMMRYALNNPEGGSLMAPAEVLELVPEHLHDIKP